MADQPARAPYSFSFDSTTVGDAGFSPAVYRTVQEGLKLLRDRLNYWDEAVRARAGAAPYERDVRQLDRMIRLGDEWLEADDDIFIPGISVGSLRYFKAGLRMLRETQEEEIGRLKREGWPEGAVDALRERVREIDLLIARNQYPEADVLWEVMPRSVETLASVADQEWDVFVSHASEDKDGFVRPLADALRARGLRVWFDEFTLRVGDSLRRSIDRGLARSRYGVVVISPSFLAKEWPQRELDGLMALEIDGRKVILPVWHEITAEQVRRASPMLADRVATVSSKGIEGVVEDLLTAIEP